MEQMTIYDFPSLLPDEMIISSVKDRKKTVKPGDKIYTVELCEITCYTFIEIILRHRDGRKFFKVKDELSQIKFFDSEEDLYFSLGDAREKVREAEKTLDYIRTQDLNYKSIEAWEYNRGWDLHSETAFIAQTKEGWLHLKGLFGYEHLCMCSSEIERGMIKENFLLELKQVKAKAIPKKRKFVPPDKTLYRCRDDVKWSYAEAGYIGIDTKRGNR